MSKGIAPGAHWRVLSQSRESGLSHFSGPGYADDAYLLPFCVSHHVPGEFDELVVGSPAWLHVEQMAEREWWLDRPAPAGTGRHREREGAAQRPS